eukprot:3476523-Pyramimonas_sp.AAC.1
MALDWVPPHQASEKAALSTCGAASLDGWAAAELRLTHTAMPSLIAEFCDVWLATTRMAVACGGRLPQH